MTHAEVIGLPERSSAALGPDLALALERGLPVESLDRVARLIAPDDPGFKYRVVARATLARRRRGDRLTIEESERVERLARLWARAMEVWQSEKKARRFLGDPHPLLRGRSPLDLARTEVGGRAVENLLGGLEFGTAV